MQVQEQVRHDSFRVSCLFIINNPSQDLVKESRDGCCTKIKTSELHYRRLFEAAQDGNLVLDAQTSAINDVNPFLIKTLGYSREEFIQNKLWDIEGSREAFTVLQMDEYICYEDLPLRAKNSKLVDVEFVSNVYYRNNPSGTT